MDEETRIRTLVSEILQRCENPKVLAESLTWNILVEIEKAKLAGISEGMRSVIRAVRTRGDETNPTKEETAS